VVSVLPKQLLEVVVRSRQVGLLVAMEQARTVAAGYLQEVVQRLRQFTKPALDQPDVLKHATEAALDGACVGPVIVRQHTSSSVNPAECRLERSPQLCCFG
jgi:hypothetical protein